MIAIPTQEQIDAWSAEADEILELLKPVLDGHTPQAIGLALAETTAIWIAGQPKEMEGPLLRAQDETARDMLPLYRMAAAALRILEKRGDRH